MRNGVPVVTTPGQTFAGRHALSHLTNAGYEQFVARDGTSYVDLAVEWAGRLDQLALVRAEMRQRVRASLLCDASLFARDFLSLVGGAWQERRRDNPLPRT